MRRFSPTTTTTTKSPSGCKTAGIYLAKNDACVANYEDASKDPATMKSGRGHQPRDDPYNLDGDNDGWPCEI